MKKIYLLLGKLPLPALYYLSFWLYVIIYYIARYRRVVVRENLQYAFPNKNLQAIRQLEKDYYRFLCDNFIEVMHSPNMTQNQLSERITITNMELIQPYLDQKQSMQFLSIHQGNWEWALQILPVKLNLPIDAIYKPLHNDQFEEILRETRSQFGSTLIPSKNAIKELLRKRREFRAFIMTAEQAPIRRDKKYWRMFFNRPSSFYLGPQKIAELTRYPVIYLKVHRKKRGYYELSFEHIAAPPFEKNSFSVLDSYIERMEHAIIEQPETWLWSNRKWRRSPTLDENSFFASDFPMDNIDQKDEN